MSKHFNKAFRGRPTKQVHPAAKTILGGLQIFGVYALGMAGTFAWGFSKAAGAVCGNGINSCMSLAGAISQEAAVWPLY